MLLILLSDVNEGLLPTDLEAAEGDRITVAGQPHQATAAIEPLGRMLNLRAVESIDINIQDLRAVEGHANSLAVDVDLLEVPLARWPQVAGLSADTEVEAPVRLIRSQLATTIRSQPLVVAVGV